jgi:hypothetical protein
MASSRLCEGRRELDRADLAEFGPRVQADRHQREDFTRVLPGGFDVVFDGIGEDDYRRSVAKISAACSALTAVLQAGRRSVAC